MHQLCQGHRCHWHRWQIMGTISGCRHLKVNLKAKIYINVNSSKKIMEIFLIEDFSHLPVSDTVGALWTANISANFQKKFETALRIFSGAWGILIHEKNQKSKISCHCPFKGTVAWGVYWTFSTTQSSELKIFKSFNSKSRLDATNFKLIGRVSTLREY